MNLPSCTRLWRTCAALGLASSLTLLLQACANDTTTLAQSASRPRLVVLIVVDGLPQRQVTAYRDQLAPDGLARFLDRGAWFSQAHYGYAFTVTAAGHATMLSGAYPHRTGIIGNEWRDQQSGETQYCTGDASATYIGHATALLDGTSPKNLKAETLGDVLKRVDARSKVIAVSGKDRGAILPAGKTGTAYMYMSQTGQFAASTYSMRQHPEWVEAFNQRRLADAWFKTTWMPLLPEAAYSRSLPDNQPWYGAGGRLPSTMGTAAARRPDAAFYSQLLRSPFGDALTLDFARAAIGGEHLGEDDAPDLLAVSLSGHDYVNHLYSAESRLSHDHLLQVDRLLQQFLRDLDRVVGPDNYIAVLTADHGFMPAPEASAAAGIESGRIDNAKVLAHLDESLGQRFGKGRWVSVSASSLLVNRRLAAQTGVAIDDVAEEARRLLLLQPGFSRAYTRRELMNDELRDAPFFDAMRKSWHPDISGDVQFILKPRWMFASGATGTTHGSPYDYDTHVPIMFYGPRWVRPARVDTRVEVVDIAPTLARWLAVPAPSASEGHLLPLAPP